MSEIRAQFFKAFQALPGIVRSGAYPAIDELSTIGLRCLSSNATSEEYERFFELYDQAPVEFKA